MVDSEGILPGLVVIIGLKLAFSIIGDNVAVRRTFFAPFFFQHSVKGNGFGSLPVLLPGLVVFPS